MPHKLLNAWCVSALILLSACWEEFLGSSISQHRVMLPTYVTHSAPFNALKCISFNFMLVVEFLKLKMNFVIKEILSVLTSLLCNVIHEMKLLSQCFLMFCRLISNTFTINSAGISPATRQREQNARGVRRRLNIAPQHVNFDIKCDSPEKETNMTEDMSFYSSNNPASSPRPCRMSLLSPGSSPSMFSIENNVQLPRVNSNDSTSMDSGYSGISNSRLRTSSSSLSSAFQFVEPKRPDNSSPPSLKTPSKYTTSLSNSMNSSGSSRMGFTVFHSFSPGSGDSNEDDYMELMDMESLDEDAQMPIDLNSLICKDIKNSSKTPDNKRPDSLVRKCLKMDASVKNSLFSSPTPKTSTITSLITTPERQCLQVISENMTTFGHRNITTGAFKRPEPPTMSVVHSKRYKCENEPPASADPMKFLQPQFPQKRPILRKSMSMNDADIMTALSRSSSEPNLIGDFSRQFCLPLVEGRHTDLKSISAQTMRQLVLGEFHEHVASFKVIDCRYPYEFEGGHIIGALNLYTHEQILEEFVTKGTENIAANGLKRNIIVFHCEFSSERGPKL